MVQILKMRHQGAGGDRDEHTAENGERVLYVDDHIQERDVSGRIDRPFKIIGAQEIETDLSHPGVFTHGFQKKLLAQPYVHMDPVHQAMGNEH